MSPNDNKTKWNRKRLTFLLLLTPAGSTYGRNSVVLPEGQLLKRRSSTESNLDDDSKMVEQKANSDSVADRDLRSNSHSRDHYDYWRWSDDYSFEDDLFYRYEGDPPLPTLSPLSGRDVSGFMLSSMGIVLGSSGGIGGGGIVIPIYIIVLGLSPRHAIPLGSVTVLGGSLAGLFLNLRRRHPLADRPIIDWDLILVMEPLVLVGALIGGIFHRVVSEKILTVLLVLLLGSVAHTILAKAKRMFEAEKRYIEHLKAARWDYLGRAHSGDGVFRSTGWSSEVVGIAIPGNELEDRTNSTVFPSSPLRTLSIDSYSTVRHLGHDERQRILILNPDFVTLRTDMVEQERVTPRAKLLALMGKFSVLIFLNITMGGGQFRSPWGIQCGTVSYWVVHVIIVAFLFSSAWAAQTYLINRHELKEIVRFDYVHGDIKWDPRNSVVYPFFFICSGFCAGTFGIGGGMITVPLMLTMGMHPAVVTATSSTMVFFTAVLSASSFAVFDLILWDYAAVCISIGFIASLMGQSIMKTVRQTKTEGSRNFERNSFIAYCIGGVILLSALLMTMQYIIQTITYSNNPYQTEEGGLCEGYRM